MSGVDDEFDTRFGTDTAGSISIAQLCVPSHNSQYGQGYQATRPEVLIETLRCLNLDVENFTFVDLGSGKGRMLLLASQAGFKSVIGVEFAAELVDISRANVEKMKLNNITVQHCEASEFHFPTGDLVVFMYNPFLVPVMRTVITNLEQQCQGRLYIIYRNPRCAEILQQNRSFKYMGCVPGWEGDRGVHLWRIAG